MSKFASSMKFKSRQIEQHNNCLFKMEDCKNKPVTCAIFLSSFLGFTFFFCIFIKLEKVIY